MTGTFGRKLVSTFIALAVSGLVLWWLLWGDAGWALIEAVGAADPWLLALAAALAIVIQLIRAWRFSILASGDLALPSWTMIGIATRLILLNFILPFKLGELGYPLMMKRAYDTPIAQGTGILILSRLQDFGVVAAILLLTSASFFEPRVGAWSPLVIASMGMMLLILPMVLVDFLPWLCTLTERWPRIHHLAEQVIFGARMVRPCGRRLLVFLLSCAIWLVHSLIAFLTVRAIDADLNFLQAAMAGAASNLAFALPIGTIAGLGPPQAAWVYMLHLDGVGLITAKTTAFLCHGLLLVTISIWGALGYLNWADKPKTSLGGHGREPSS
ncbi:MAG: lysylphosphatidylglycerol synthase transmembrane domain-containing protein [Geminicoccaceae bacterium]